MPTAFNSGGVASGPMTSTFMLPFAVGACEAIGGTVMKGRLADVEQFAGISQTEIDGDREIIFILSSVKTSAQIMEEVNKEFGTTSDANGIIVAIPAEKAYKI